MSFEDDSMDFDDMLDKEEDVEIHSEEEPRMSSQLKSDATLFSIEPAAMTDIEKIVVCATTPSKSSSSSCSRAVVPLVPSPESSSSSTTATPLKNRRLRVKTTADHDLFVAPVTLPVLGGEDWWRGFEEEDFNSISYRNQYHRVYNKFRKWSTSRGLDEPSDIAPLGLADDDGGVDVELSPKGDHRKDTFILFMEQSNAPQWLRTWMEMHMFIPKSHASNKWLLAKSVLLTWNGPWGVMPLDSADVSVAGDISSLCKKVGDSAWGQKLVHKFFVFINQLAAYHHVCEWAASVEICTRTLDTGGLVRLHCHGFLRKHHNKFNDRQPERYLFESSVPDKRAHHAGCKPRGCGSNAALYYLQCPKLGMVATTGSKQPFVDYAVNGSWIFNLVQSLKMCYTMAHCN
jgi:hypothetical protein